MEIDTWLKKFKEHWQNHNITEILNLFDKNVIYYETPFTKLNNFNTLAKEWEEIKNQKNIILNYKLFPSSENKHSVIWELQYTDKENIKKKFLGTYLITLNKEGKCIYFYQCCESL